MHVASGKAADSEEFFTRVVKLTTGEAVVFSPTSLRTKVDDTKLNGNQELVSFDRAHALVRVRGRISSDGGVPILATALCEAASLGNESGRVTPDFEDMQDASQPFSQI